MDEIITWLLNGDVSIKYQTKRDILGEKKVNLQKKISKEGWGEKFLSYQNKNGHWGRGFYFPKWTSTHYTLLDLKNLNMDPNTRSIRKALNLIFDNEMRKEEKYKTPSRTVSTDICINGMVLNYASYFKSEEKHLISIVDYLLENQMDDGGFNCQSQRIGAKHSSLHTTLSVLEGINEYIKNGYKYKVYKLKKIEKSSKEFILQHRLFKSDKTREIINSKFLMLPYPSRWRYDMLRCLDYFYNSRTKYDSRMDDAIQNLLSKRNNDGLWPLQAKHPGEFHFEMEKPGKSSRINTLRALRVLKFYNAL